MLVCAASHCSAHAATVTRPRSGAVHVCITATVHVVTWTLMPTGLPIRASRPSRPGGGLLAQGCRCVQAPGPRRHPGGADALHVLPATWARRLPRRQSDVFGRPTIRAVSASLTVRPARVEDVAQMAGVNVRCWQETYRGLVSDAVLDAPGFLV